ncbi:MAG TPA: 2-C-methyl-D-erythritol 4-phosphate cytidylyltransferase [Candidatus Fermentibacter sp.]|nr:2-C-methyl-D-erythritol 4-phosphate cytidylyltransferase [Candidatus Fermentibacter sp.]
MKPTERPRWGCIIVAAGRSDRFGGGVPKQFLPLGGRPVLHWSVDTAMSAGGIEDVCVVLPPGLPGDDLPSGVTVAAGGARRRDSAASGLAALGECTHLLVHDAARPLASRALFRRVMAACLESGAAVPAVPVTDTLKKVSGGLIEATVDRTGIMRSQTPQGFERGLLEAALGSGGDFTDEAQAVEASGARVARVEGEETNIKITTPMDMELVRALSQGSGSRTGIGLDFHPFDESRPLVLCGCRLDGRGGLSGHSDGDAALHAVMDAILSAARLGDIGTLFPPSDPAFEGADSSALLREVTGRAAGEGWQVGSVDLTIIGERPRISLVREDLRLALARALGLPTDAVWIKGTTTNTLGALGRGEGLGALALVEISRRVVRG